MSKRIILTISDELQKSVERLAKDMGISIPEYIRFLVLKAVENDLNTVM